MKKIFGKMGNRPVAKRFGFFSILLIVAVIGLTTITRVVGSGDSTDSIDSTYLQSSGRIANQTRMDNESARVSVLAFSYIEISSNHSKEFQPQNGEVITTNIATKHILYR